MMPWLQTWLAFGAGLLLPGWLLTTFYLPRTELSWAERLPIAFVLGAGLLSIPALILPFLPQAHLSLLVGFSAITTLFLGWRYLYRPSAARITVRTHPRPNLLLLGTVLLFCGGLIALSLATASTWSTGDNWTYLRYIRLYLDGDFSNNVSLAGQAEELIPRALNSWWILQACLVWLAGVDPVAWYTCYFPSIILIGSLLAFYGLGRQLFKTPNLALLLVLVQGVYLLSGVGSHDWLGRGFFDRILEDKFLIALLILPVTIRLALIYLNSGGRGQWGAVVLSTLFLAGTHPIGIAQWGIIWSAFTAIELFWTRPRRTLYRLGLVYVPLGLTLLLPLAQRWLIQQGGTAFGYAGGTDVQFTLSQSRLWILSALKNHYLAHPQLIAHPLTVLAILLTPWLFLYLKQSQPARFLLASMAAPLLLLYTPWLTPLFGRVITPWMLWRIAWILPVPFILTFFLARLLAHLNRSVKVQFSNHYSALPPIMITLLLTGLLWPYITDGVRLLQSRPDYSIRVSQKDILKQVQAYVQPGEVILADSELNTYLPAYSARLRVFTFRFSGPPENLEAVARFYRTRLVTEDVLNLLARWQVNYIILERTHLLTDQLDQLPNHFRRVYQNDGYILYQVLSPPAVNLIVQANTHLLRGELDTAGNGYRTALTSGTSLPLAHFGQGELLRRQGRLTEAETAYRQALAAAPTFRPAALALADLLVYKGNLSSAEELLTRIQAQLPADPQIAQKLGELYLQQGQIEPALIQLRQTITRPPGTPAYHLTLAQLLQREGLDEQTIAEYQQVIGVSRISSGRFYPGFILGTRNTLAHLAIDQLVQAYIGLGKLYQQQGDLAQAEQAYHQVITIAPDRSEGYLALNQLYQQIGRPQKAITLLQRATRSVPNATWPHLELGKLYLQKSQADLSN